MMIQIIRPEMRSRFRTDDEYEQGMLDLVGLLTAGHGQGPQFDELWEHLTRYTNERYAAPLVNR